MAYVHFLGQVRRGHVDSGALVRAGFAHAELWVGQCSVQARGQGLSVLEEVEETWAGDFDLADLLIGWQRGNDFFSQIAWLKACRFGQHHGDVAGEVAVGFVTGVFHLNRWRQAFRQHTFCDELSKGLLNQLANGVFHGLLFRPQAR